MNRTIPLRAGFVFVLAVGVAGMGYGADTRGDAPILWDMQTTWGDQALSLAACDDMVEPPRLFRCTVVRAMAAGDFARGPCVLDASITVAGATVATVHIDLDHLGQLATGADLVFAPGAVPAGAEEARLEISLTDAGRHLNEHLTHKMYLPANAARLLVECGDELADHHVQDPLPWLWFEQGRERVITGDGRGVVDIDWALNQWIGGKRPPPSGPFAGWPLAVDAAADAAADAAEKGQAGEAAWRDVRDGSVQPVRWHRPAGTITAVALWCADTVEPPTKSAWPGPPAAQMDAALAAGVAVVEAYPAGDRHWDGIGLARARDLLPLINPGNLPLFLVGSGRGAAAAVKLARVAAQVRGVLVIAPQWGAYGQAVPAGVVFRCDPGDGGDPASATVGAQAIAADQAGFWMPPGPSFTAINASLAATAAVAVDANPVDSWGNTGPGAASPGVAADPFDHGPLTAYARGPFVVVVGTGESVAAAADAEGLARSFVIAWAHHAHGFPPVIRDSDYRRRDWRGHNLVLVGNPLSNAVLGDLADDLHLPITWDFRTEIVTYSGKTLIALRSERRPLAIAVASPRHDGTGILIIDGAPSWLEDPHQSPLPLAHMPAFVLGDASVDNFPGAPVPGPGIRLRHDGDGAAAWVELASGAVDGDGMMPAR